MRWLAFLGLAVLFGIVVLFMALSPPHLEPPPRSDTWITGVTVIQPGQTRLVDHAIEIRDGRIVALRPGRDDDPAPICPDCFVIPGLIDAHVHTPPRIALGNPRLFALLYLAHGVTTVRDVGASEPGVARVAERLNRGEWVGPRMLRCGPVLEGDPPAWPLATVLTEPTEAAAAVHELAASGVDCIKIYNEIRPAVYAAIDAAAREHGLPVVGHVPHAVGIRGVRDFESQHLTGIPYVSRPRPPAGWDIRRADVLALGDAEIDAALALARERGVSFTPTLANFRLRLIASDPERFPPTPAAAWLPLFWHTAWDFLAGHPETEAEIEQALAAMRPLRAIVGRAHARGIDVLAGTDTLMPWVVPGEALHQELAELALALGSAEAALAAATTVNGRQLGAGELGVIAPGARADLLLLPGDPTRDLAALAEWRFVVADGRHYGRALLDGWLERYRAHFRSRLYGLATDRLIRAVGHRYDHSGSAERP